MILGKFGKFGVILVILIGAVLGTFCKNFGEFCLRNVMNWLSPAFEISIRNSQRRQQRKDWRVVISRFSYNGWQSQFDF